MTASPEVRRPRVGHIQFLNSLPLYYGLVQNNVLLNIELYKGTPTELNRWLIAGKLDISAISSIEYARHSDELLLLPKLTVSSNGEVKSILLVSKLPIEELDGTRIALTSTSATSQALTQIVLEEGYGARASYFTCPPDLGEMLLEADAALLIGDSALRVLYEKPDLYLYDLGKEWKDLTGERMVFAVWAARRDFAAAQPELVKEVYEAFVHSMSYSLSRVEEVAKATARWEPYSVEFLVDYLKSLSFDFDEDYQRGLSVFFEKAKALGFLERVPKLEFAAIAQEA